MKTVAVVPMKLNNSRLPNKNTKSFTNGKPLCSYILNTLKSVKSLDEIYVYCSNSDITAFIPEGVKYIKRSEKLDRDVTSMNEVLKAFVNDVDADIYVLAHATAPFISPEKIQDGLNAVLSGQYDSSFAVKKIQDFMWRNNKPLNYDLDNIPRTQDLEPYFIETSGFYIFRKNIVAEMNRRIGNAPYMVTVSEVESIDIDEQEDFEIADAVYSKIIVPRCENAQNANSTTGGVF